MPPQEIRRADVVEYEGYQWIVEQRDVRPGLPGRPAPVELTLSRSERVEQPAKFGRPTRYRTERRTARVLAARVRLVASQARLFGEIEPERYA